MVEDGEDWHGLQTTNLAWTFQELLKVCELNCCTVSFLILLDSIVAFFPFPSFCNITVAYLDISYCYMVPLEFFRHHSLVLRMPVLGCHRTAVWSFFLLHTLSNTWSILTMRPIGHCELVLLKSGWEDFILVRLCFSYYNNVLYILLLIAYGQYSREEDTVAVAWSMHRAHR